jgi:hypothetical protein
LQPGTTPAGVDASPEGVAQIAEALAAGYLVIVPERPVPLDGQPLTGWWQVDPQTGETFDRMASGGSQESAEYMIILGEIFKAIYAAKKLAACLVAIVGAVAGVLMLVGAVESTPGLLFAATTLPYHGIMCAVFFVH